MNDAYFKASLQNTLNPEVGTFDNVGNKSGVFTLEDGEYYLTNNTSNAYRVYYPTEDIHSIGFTIEFDINYSNSGGFKWCLLFNGDDSSYWHGFGTSGSDLEFRGQGLSLSHITSSPNIWLHVKCVFDYYLEQNIVRIYVNNSEVNTFNISKNYGIKYIDILGNSVGYVADAKIKNIIIYNSSKKHFLDTLGLTTLWSKIKSLFATKTELNAKANDDDVVHKSGDETIGGSKTFNSMITCSSTVSILGTSTDKYLSIQSGNSWDNGGRLSLYGKEHSENSGQCEFTSFNSAGNANIFRFSVDGFYGLSVGGTLNLGTPSNKWNNVYANTFNGINPGALSLPSNAYTNVDTTDWDLTCQNALIGNFTPTANGWLMLHIANSGTGEVNFWIIGGVIRINNKSTLNTSDNNNFNMITIPVEKDKTYTIYGNASEYVVGRKIAYCRFMPCQGNV